MNFGKFKGFFSIAWFTEITYINDRTKNQKLQPKRLVLKLKSIEESLSTAWEWNIIEKKLKLKPWLETVSI